MALAETQQYAAAIREFRETLRLRPNDAEARDNLQLAIELDAKSSR